MTNWWHCARRLQPHFHARELLKVRLRVIDLESRWSNEEDAKEHAAGAPTITIGRYAIARCDEIGQR